jgi:hypothetical protein
MKSPLLFACCSALAIALALVACGPRHVDALDPASLPENIRADYAVFASRCSKCHALARPLNAGITDDEQWRLYVNRMRRQPGSGITMDDQVAVLRFLEHYARGLRDKKRGNDSGRAVPASAVSVSPPASDMPSAMPGPPPLDGGAD